DPSTAFASSSGEIKAVAGIGVDAAAGDLAVPLAPAQLGGNTRVSFTCGKDTGGGTRDVHEGTWDALTGGVLYNPETQTLVAVEATFDTRSLRTDAQALTTTVTTKEKWFDIDQHPLATFTCDTVTLSDAATSSHTHDLVGRFTLNGISQAITIPARVAFAGPSLTLDADFTILRSDYDVEKRASSVAGTLGGVVSTVDDEVEMTVRITASPDPAAVIGELAKRIEAQKEALLKSEKDIAVLQGLAKRLEMLEERTDRLARSGPALTQAVDTDALPPRFTERSEGYDKNYPFAMRLVAGDPDAGIEPFYMSEHEVTWGMFDKWMQAGDLDNQSANVVSELRDVGLRPTPLYGDPQGTVQFNFKDNPVMGVSRLTAVAYCKWISEQTGRTYRLPTQREWMHALQLGGGIPDDLDGHALHADNAPKNETTLLQETVPVKSKTPNAIGLYDMLGSVAEWVTDTGTDRVVVGGSIFTPPEQLTADWRAVEDLEIWSESYPNYPKSRYWYSDFYVTGIRLVCEPASVASHPPTD
ncbi:MAG: SUMF1/EgtB/PvdO family nonheme iron enzyme, partial [Phycisphaeraceae bacterium]